MGCLHSAGNNYEEDDDGYNTLRVNKNGVGKLKLLYHCRCVQIGFLYSKLLEFLRLLDARFHVHPMFSFFFQNASAVTLQF